MLYTFAQAFKGTMAKHFWTPRGMISRGVSFFSTKIQIFSENLTKIQNILTCWSVAHIDLNYEKMAGRKSRLTVPLKEKFSKREKEEVCLEIS